MEGNGNGIIEIVPQNFPAANEERHKKYRMIVDNPAEIRSNVSRTQVCGIIATTTRSVICLFLLRICYKHVTVSSVPTEIRLTNGEYLPIKVNFVYRAVNAFGVHLVLVQAF